jgi:hypothetical protein
LKNIIIKEKIEKKERNIPNKEKREHLDVPHLASDWWTHRANT